MREKLRRNFKFLFLIKWNKTEPVPNVPFHIICKTTYNILKKWRNHNENLKKDFRSMFDWIRNRDITRVIFTNTRMVIFNRSGSNISRNIMVTLLKGGLHMTIVVKKVPKCLRGIVKLLFGIKD